MPKVWAMAHLSRPYQIALLAMGLIAAVWFVALRGHSATTSGSGSPPAPVSAPAPSASSQAEKAGGASSVYKGSAPGVAGLTRAIAKAHGAVAESQQSAQQLQEKSAQASSSTAAGPAAGASAAASQPKSSATSTGSATTGGSSPKGTGSLNRAKSTTPAKQALVENELKQGRTVILLFWSPKGEDDVAVRHQLQVFQAFHNPFGLPENRRIAMHEARANEVASFGTITRAVQIYQTPTILIINRKGKTKTLTGLVDAYSIQQAINEARHA
jgi:hypothetical protein